MTSPARETLRDIALQLSEVQIDGLGRYIEWFGAAHVEGCPADDTCDCICRLLNDAVNHIHAQLRASLTEVPTGPGDEADMARLEDAAGARLQEEARQRAEAHIEINACAKRGHAKTLHVHGAECVAAETRCQRDGVCDDDPRCFDCKPAEAPTEERRTDAEGTRPRHHGNRGHLGGRREVSTIEAAQSDEGTTRASTQTASIVAPPLVPVGAEPVEQNNGLYKTLYYELLFAVGNKHQGESRHQTALRYIRECEAPDNIANAKSAAEPPV